MKIINKLAKISIAIFFYFYSQFTYCQSYKVIQENHYLGFEKKNKNPCLYKKRFFYSFPNNFSDFVKTFGWNSENDEESPLYNKSRNYIDDFFNIKNISNENKSLKIIAISIGGTWDSDGVNFFQEDLRVYFSKNYVIFSQTLQKKNKKERRLFWRFYFDTIASDYRKRYFEEATTLIRKTGNLNMIDIMLKSYSDIEIKYK